MHYVMRYVSLEPRGSIFDRVDMVLSSCLFVSGT